MCNSRKLCADIFQKCDDFWRRARRKAGDNFDELNEAVGASSQIGTTYDPGPLELNKTYYWRVDEFDGAVTQKGDVWSFTTLPNITITDPNPACTSPCFDLYAVAGDTSLPGLANPVPVWGYNIVDAPVDLPERASKSAASQ